MGSSDRRPETDLIARWRDALRASRDEAARGEYSTAITRLERILAAVSGGVGSGTNALLPRTWGLLGTLYYHAGDHDKARAITAEARDYCERIGDREGVETYTRTLSVMDLS